MNFDIIWRYCSWTNQTLAMIVLWTGATYLCRTKENNKAWLIPAIPAAFMSAVSMTYIIQAKEGLELGTSISYPGGIIFAVLCVAIFIKNVLMPKYRL